MENGHNETGLEIAVIGMAGRFPGARNIDEFWENLKNGVESITFFTGEELNASGVEPRLREDPSFVKTHGGLLEDKEYFDAFFFDYTPREAEIMDPQVRVFHECAWEALEHAGYAPGISECMIGLYAGAMNGFAWEALAMLSGKSMELGMFDAGNISNAGLMGMLVAYKLNLAGPVFSLYTACSTSLVAVHQACQGLLSVECDMALAGGVRVTFVTKPGGYVYEEGMINSPDGHCRAFDREAGGTVSGEGVGIVVLKRLKDAIHDGDTIHAVIKGSAVNNDGSQRVNFSAPGLKGQSEVIRSAHEMAEIDPETVTYVETHGTGTPLGDPIEIAALKQAFNSSQKNFCAVGSVKSNIGHLGSAAGVTGLMKTVLALKHRLIPPSLHFKSPNPRLEIENSPFYVNTSLKRWEANGAPLRAGVSSFGIGGSNAHVVLEEWQENGREGTGDREQEEKHRLILLSAKTPSALDEMTENLTRYLKNNNGHNPGVKLADAAYTLQVGRRSFPHRRMLVCSDTEKAVEHLSSPGSREVRTFSAPVEEPPVVFMFPGLGSQYVDMGRELYENEPLFREEMDRCFEILNPLLGFDIKSILYPEGKCETDIDRFDISQAVIFTFEYALAKLIMGWGITPAALIGYSFGEYTAACIAGVFSLEDALALVVARGELIRKMPGGIMLSVPLPVEEVKPLLTGGISMAINNGPSCVVSGPVDRVEAFEQKMKEKRYMCTRLPGSFALHSRMMDPLSRRFQEKVRTVSLREPQIPYVSNVTGTWITPVEATDPSYWANHLRQTVRFSEGIRELITDSRRVFVEVGPGRDLISLMVRYLDTGAENRVINLVRRPGQAVPDTRYLLDKIGRLWLYGTPIDWTGLYPGEERYRIPLPTYPFQRKKYWIEGNPYQLAAQSVSKKNFPGVRSRLPMADWFYIPSWKQADLLYYHRQKTGEAPTWLVFLDQTGIGDSIVRQWKTEAKDVVTLKAGQGFKKINEDAYEIDPGNEQHYRALLAELYASGKRPGGILHLFSIDELQKNESGVEPVERRRETGFYSLLYLAQAIGKQEFVQDIQLIAAANGLYEVSGDEPLSPGKSTLLGPVKVIPQEYPYIRCRLIDVLLPPPGDGRRETLVNRLMEECESQSFDTEVAYRGKHRWVRTYESLPLGEVAPGELPLKEKGVYLVTGGLGFLGLILAKLLVKEVKAKLILTGRTPLPPAAEWGAWLSSHDTDDPVSRKITAVRELEAMGGDVLAVGVDTADREGMKALLERAEERFGPLNGVIHGAGVVKGKSFSLIADIDKTLCEEQFHPKVHGLILLDELLQGKTLDFCCVLSSLSPVLGGLQFVAYSASNSFMDAFVQERNRSGSLPRWFSIAWGGGVPEEDTMKAFRRILPINNVNRVVVFSEGNLHEKIDQWVKLESLREEENIENEDMSVFSSRPELTSAYFAPSNPLEQTVAGIWGRLFGYEEIGSRDDFFELGGDSLKAITVISRMHKQLNVEVPLAEFFKRATVEKIAEYIKNSEKDVHSSIEPSETKEYYTVSSAQKRLYILQQMEETGGVAYNEREEVLLDHPPDRERLELTFRRLIERHESFRTSFHTINDRPVQKIHREVDFSIEYRDVSGETSPGGGIQELKESLITPFDLSRAPLLRVWLVKTGKGEYLLVLDTHHIIADGLSGVILSDEFMALYSGKELPPLRMQYKDFSEWQNHGRRKTVIKQQESFWLRTFADEIPVLNLPTDYPRPRMQSFEGNWVHFVLDEKETRVLQDIAKETNATLYMVILSIYAFLLSKLSGQEDIVVGTPIAARKHADLEKIIGMFVNTLALRIYPEGNKTFKEFLADVRTRSLEAFENQDYPFEDLVDKLSVRRDTSRNPVFDVMFNMLNQNDYRGHIPEIDEEKPYEHQKRIARFDLILQVADMGKGILFFFEYCTKLFKPRTIERFIRYFKKIVSELSVDPERKLADIEIMSEGEKEKLLELSRGIHEDYGADLTLHRLFEEQVEKTPDHTALVGETCRRGATPHPIPLTYRELNEQSNRLAHLLREKGVGPNIAVGIMVERSIEMIAAVIAVLKAGGAYLPIEVDYPAERIQYMLRESGISFLLTTGTGLDRVPITSLKNMTVDGGEVIPFVTPARGQITDLSTLPFPDRTLVNYEKYHRHIGIAMAKHTVSIQATRGCPFNCAYCHKIWPKKHVARTAEHIFEEIRYYYDACVRRFVFIDDVFNLDMENSRRLLEKIKAGLPGVQLFFPNGLRGDLLTPGFIDLMVEAGTVNIDLALESASPRIQKLIRKNLNLEKFKTNVRYIAENYPHVLLEMELMIGFPTETEEEALLTLEFLKELKWVHFPNLNILKIYPNTDMYRLAVDNGIGMEKIHRSANLAYHELPETLPFSKDFVREYQTKFMGDYFLSKERLLHVLKHQVRVLTEDELVQKYDSYLPMEIKSFKDILESTRIKEKELGNPMFLPGDYMEAPEFREKIAHRFPRPGVGVDPFRVLLLDLSLFFSDQSVGMLYDMIEEPLGLMYLMSHVREKFGGRVLGKIAKSRVDFDSFEELKTLVSDFKPDLIGIRALSFYKDFFHRSVLNLRQWGVDVPIVAGGPYATSDYRLILQDANVDLVVLGEGELTFAELVEKMMNNGKKLPGEDVLRDIRGLAFIKTNDKALQKERNRDILLVDEMYGKLDRYPGENIENINRDSDLLYIIYTSGSTGKPKGAMLEHRNLVNLLIWGFRNTNLDFSSVLQFSTISFDVSFHEIFSTLLYGGRLSLIHKDTRTDIPKLFEVVEKNKIRTLFLPMSMLNVIFSEEDYIKMIPACVTHIQTAGEQVVVSDAFRNYLREHNVHLHNHYGPAEAHVVTALTMVPTGDIPTLPSIGTPVSNTGIHIRDRYGNIVPIGVPGELYIDGIQVGRGYMNNPQLTAERFNRSYKTYRSYKTGDLTRRLPCGNIEFLGRIDHQVKIRGFRVELGEIESRLLNHPAVKEAVVVVPPSAANSPGEKYLCAYVVPDGEVSISGLREYLSQKLPDYMIPAHFVFLDTIPVTPNGKIDRRALPEPRLQSDGQGAAPRNEIEKRLAKIWADVLGLTGSIGIDDNFFQLGGHSLKATITISRILKEFNVEFPLGKVFAGPTIRQFAAFIKDAKKTAYGDIEPVEKKEYYPQSSAQKRLFFLDRIDDVGTAYNLTEVVEAEKSMDKEKLETVFKELIARHESLGTSFGMVGDQPIQRIHPRVEFKMEYYDGAVEGIQTLIRPFVLSRPPLLRAVLLENGEGNRRVLVDMPHIISDGTSHHILAKEFNALCRGEKLPPLRLQYKDFAAWRNSEAQEAAVKQQESYWLQTFPGELPVLELPTDYPRPGKQSFEGAVANFLLSREETRVLNGLAGETSATLFMSILAVFNVLLSKLSTQEDIIVGTPVAARRHPDLEFIVGMFVNTLPIRNYPAGEKTFKGFLTELKNRTLESLRNQEYPFEELVDKLPVRRDTSRNPVFDVMLNLLNQSDYPGEITGMEDDGPPVHLEAASRFDLTLTAVKFGERCFLSIEYCTGLFKPDTIDRFIGYFRKILSVLPGNTGRKLSEIEIITESEKRQILFDFNRTETLYHADKTIHRLFEEQVQRGGDRIAVVEHKNGSSITYNELNEKSGRLARLLEEKGVKTCTIVGIMLERSIEMIFGLFGILKAGGAYLPIDPGYPRERIRYMLADSSAGILLSKMSELSADIEVIDLNTILTHHTQPLDHSSSPPDLAYVIYTSGSTGKPKGVVIRHRSVINFIKGITDVIPFTGKDCILSLTTISFDIFVLETLLPLSRGSRVVMGNEEEQVTPALMASAVERENVTIFQATPSRLQLIAGDADASRSLRLLEYLIVGGEALPPLLLEKVRTLVKGKIYNVYGPTETTVWSTIKDVSGEEVLNIGKPIANTRIHILDKEHRLQPVGVPGELWISGDGLAAGYLNRPELTAERFIPVEEPSFNRSYRSYKGCKFYKTGDLARWLPDGNIEFLGRIDHQVKVRGFRIELGEIELHLTSHPGIKKAVVVPREDTGGNKSLCAYIVTAGGTLPDVPELRTFLSRALPDYMIPSHFMEIDAVPLTPNGKVNRKALPDPEIRIEKGYEAPRNETEQKLVEIWSELLDIDTEIIGIDHNFFDLGGNSPRLIQLANRINNHFADGIRVVDLFNLNTIGKIAEHISVSTAPGEKIEEFSI